MSCLNHRIPACAGMTAGVAVRHLSGMAKGLSGWQPICFLFFRHSGAGRNPGKALPGCLNELQLFPVRAAVTGIELSSPPACRRGCLVYPTGFRPSLE